MKSVTQVIQNLLKPYIDNHRQTAEANLAPVETNASSASQNYSVGQQLILNDVLYNVTAAITAGDALSTTGAGANITIASKLSTNIIDLLSKFQAISTSIAPTQSTLTASRAYEIGEQFYYNGALYVATSAIANGAAITINGNCKLSNSIEKQIQSYSTNISIGGNANNNCKLTMFGNLGVINGGFYCENSTGETISIGLPSDVFAFGREMMIIRDVTDGTSSIVYLTGQGSECVINTYNHSGTLTVGHVYNFFFIVGRS